MTVLILNLIFLTDVKGCVQIWFEKVKKTYLKGTKATLLSTKLYFIQKVL